MRVLNLASNLYPTYLGRRKVTIATSSDFTTGYDVARAMHDFLWESTAQRALWTENGMRITRTTRTQTSQLSAQGEIAGRPAYQTLSLGKNWSYYLSTVFTEPGGPHLPSSISPNDTRTITRRNLKQSLYFQIYTELTGLDVVGDTEAVICEPFPWQFNVREASHDK